MKLVPPAVLALVLSAASCQSGTAAAPAAPASAPARVQPQPPATTNAKVEVPTTGVRSITLPAMDVVLPSGPGKPAFLSACMLCHTPRYVLMQPLFPKKKWTEEVEKMKKAYGAPIADQQVEPILDYLVSIRGNGQ